jgi:hypothetical protein
MQIVLRDPRENLHSSTVNLRLYPSVGQKEPL